MRGAAPRQDDPAQGFFEWGEINHLFPYLRLAPSAVTMTADSDCAGRKTVLLHKSDYDLLTEMPPSLRLRQELPTYRIYSELP